MALYKHPSVVNGDLSRGEDKWPVRAGCVDCPQDLAEGAHFALPTPKEAAAYENHPDTKRERAEATKAAADAAKANEKKPE